MGGAMRPIQIESEDKLWHRRRLARIAKYCRFQEMCSVRSACDVYTEALFFFWPRTDKRVPTSEQTINTACMRYRAGQWSRFLFSQNPA